MIYGRLELLFITEMFMNEMGVQRSFQIKVLDIFAFVPIGRLLS